MPSVSVTVTWLQINNTIITEKKTEHNRRNGSTSGRTRRRRDVFEKVSMLLQFPGRVVVRGDAVMIVVGPGNPSKHDDTAVVAPRNESQWWRIRDLARGTEREGTLDIQNRPGRRFGILGSCLARLNSSSPPPLPPHTQRLSTSSMTCTVCAYGNDGSCASLVVVFVRSSLH